MARADLVLLHWPCDTFEQTLAAYAQLEDALDSGLARAIGVSNFNTSQLSQLLDSARVAPAVNQCGHSIGNHAASELGSDDATAAFCASRHISYSAYSPLGGLSGVDVLSDPAVRAVARTRGKSAAQVALRWLVQQNITFVTAGTNPDYLRDDLDVFDFDLSKEELQTLAAI